MALMEWDESMSVGVEELDAQHQKLIALINEAYEAIQKHDTRLVSTILSKMHDYAAEHFSTEERYMKESGYPELQQHKFYHTKFTTDVEDFLKNQFERTNLSKIFVYLSRWLTQHIMEEDMKYSSYLSQQSGEGTDE